VVNLTQPQAECKSQRVGAHRFFAPAAVGPNSLAHSNTNEHIWSLDRCTKRITQTWAGRVGRRWTKKMGQVFCGLLFCERLSESSVTHASWVSATVQARKSSAGNEEPRNLCAAHRACLAGPPKVGVKNCVPARCREERRLPASATGAGGGSRFSNSLLRHRVRHCTSIPTPLQHYISDQSVDGSWLAVSTGCATRLSNNPADQLLTRSVFAAARSMAGKRFLTQLPPAAARGKLRELETLEANLLVGVCLLGGQQRRLPGGAVAQLARRVPQP